MTDWKMSWLCGFEMSYTSMQYNSGSNSKVYGVFCKQSVSQKKCGLNTRLEKMNKKGLQNNRQNFWYLNNMFVD